MEMSITSQMGEDILLASRGDRPLYGYLTSKDLPTAEGIVAHCREIQEGKIQPMEVL